MRLPLHPFRQIHRGKKISYIQQEIENPLSVKLLSGEFVAGDTIKVDVDAQDKLTFDKLRMS